MARVSRRSAPAGDDEPTRPDGAADEAAGAGSGRGPSSKKAAEVTPLRRNVPVPNRPSLRLSPLLGAMPPELVETFHYLVARLQLTPESQLSPIAVVAPTHGEGVTTVTRALGAVIANDLDASVCIVDISTPTPATQKDAATKLGLFDVVDQNLPLKQALRATADDRLMILGSGEPR